MRTYLLFCVYINFLIQFNSMDGWMDEWMDLWMDR